MTFIALFTLNTIIWSLVGLARHLLRSHTRNVDKRFASTPVRKKDVAVIIAAHNEAMIIENTIRSLKRRLTSTQIFIVSDNSVDDTASIAQLTGVNVLKLRKNRGKAGALLAGIKKFKLTSRYKVILILDADTQLSSNYFKTGLPLFNRSDVVAVAGSARTFSDSDSATMLGNFLLSYRQRVYVIFQIFVKYGQATRFINTVFIVPGFASMYRSEAIRSIDIAAENLIIEDFNMTFEIHAKKLGKIAFHPNKAIAYTQDPDQLGEYINQTHRWSLGFWQTLARHKLRFNLFGFTVAASALEIVFTNLALTIFVLLYFLLNDGSLSNAQYNFSVLANLLSIILVIVLYDYAMTIFTAVYLRRYRYLLIGILFPLMRFIEFIVFVKVILSLSSRSFSNGRWTSPSRRPSV